MSQHVAVRPDGLFNNPAYTQVMKTTGTTTVYVSGQVALDATGATVGAGDLAAQTEQVMANLKIAVEAAGATLADVVKVTTYVVGYQPEHRPVITAARASYFPDGFPASTLVGVQALAAPEWLIEVEAVAVIGSDLVAGDEPSGRRDRHRLPVGAAPGQASSASTARARDLGATSV